MRFLIKVLWIVVGVLLLVSGLFLKFSPVSQSVLGSSANSYYDGRCVDVSQYYSQGFVNTRLDSHLCQVVGLNSPVSTVELGIFSNCWANVYNRVNGGTTTADPCKSSLGDGWIGGCRDVASSTKGVVTCTKYGLVEKGGFENVLNYCTFEPGQILVAESFVGARTINKNDLRYPIASFCRAHPTIITDSILGISQTSSNVPQDLVDGKSVSISSSQTVTVFYVIDNSYDLPNNCDPGDNLALSLKNNRSCQSTLGFTYVCSDGVFDALSGSCVVTPGLNNLCVKGRFDVQSNTCVYNPPFNVDCSDGSTYDATRDVCVRSPMDKFSCNAPYLLYNPSESQCNALGGTYLSCPQCPTDKVCSSSVCQARCDVGISCRWQSPLVSDCRSDISRKGTCKNSNNDTQSVCGVTDTWDGTYCIQSFSNVPICPDGSTPTSGECLSEPKDYKECSNTQVLNNGECIDKVQQKNTVKNIGLYLIIGGLVIVIIFLLIKTKRKK